MAARSKRLQLRQALRGWLGWVPFIVAPFMLLFCEAWFHAQTVRNGYKKNEINKMVRSLKVEINELDVKEAHLKRMERIDDKAVLLGLIQAEPNQIIEIGVNEEPVPANPMKLADNLEEK